MATYCVICGKQKDGIEIKGDRVIEAIRWFKRTVTKDEKGNRLVVCRECYPVYKKKRSRYTSRQTLYLVLGVLFAILGLAVSFSFFTILLAALLLIGLYLLSLLNYTPDLSIKEGHKKATHKHKQ